MPVDVKYETTVVATGGRDGSASATDGSFQTRLSTPKELGGAGGDGANPEQLFAAGYAACFLGAMKAISSRLNVKVPADTTVTATIGIGPRSEGGFGLTAAIKVDLPGVPQGDAKRLTDEAHKVCPYSNATRGNIEVTLSVA